VQIIEDSQEWLDEQARHPLAEPVTRQH
jgi:hypothetical protein